MIAPPKVVCVGEVLWDLLPSGPQLGGAPSNLACHVAGLGGEASLISRVGDDALGRQTLAQLAARGVNVRAVGVDATRPTGTVSVELSADGQPRFTIHEGVAWDGITADSNALAAVTRADAVCFGSLAQRTSSARAAVASLLTATRPGCFVLFDVNLRPPFFDQATLETSLTVAHGLKLNDAELVTLARMFGLSGSAEAVVEGLAARFELESVLLTLGANGSRLWSGGRWFEEPGRAVVVRDTVGAGDSFTAVFVLGRILGWDRQATLRAATEIAAYVCTQAGATPSLPADLLRTLPGNSLARPEPR